ncbi:MAG: hypothetical protein M3163_16210 [Actinomycetota bacterium]|nr:hypothetical protein [Actinomycetota bacterium]
MAQAGWPWWLCWYCVPWVSGELALESIDADGQGQHEPGRRRQRLRRDRPQLQGLHATEAAGAHVGELLLSHAGDIGLTAADL